MKTLIYVQKVKLEDKEQQIIEVGSPKGYETISGTESFQIQDNELIYSATVTEQSDSYRKFDISNL